MYNLKNIKDEYLYKLTRNEKDFLEIILQKFKLDEYITIEKLSDIIAKANSSLRVYMKSLTSKNIMIAIGENKGRKYQINIDIFTI